MMWQPLTERQTRFVALAQELAAAFATRAAEHDRRGSFPFENFDDIRAAGLPSLVAPVEYGGWGASLLETVMTLEALAMGDGSTALSLAMHMQTLGGIVENRAWPEALFAQVCRGVVERGALINAVASEPELGSPSRGGAPKTTARPLYTADGEPTIWILNGHKTFASMSPTLDYMIVLASLEDGSQRVANFLVVPGQGVEIVETWDALGLRATGSHDVVFTHVHVPHSHLIYPTDPTKTLGAKVGAWFPLTVSAVYVGIATAAHRTAIRYARERTPTALGKPIAELESIQRHIGQASLLLHQARCLLYHAADLWDRCPALRPELAGPVVAAKYTATNNAVTAIDHCMRVAGGASMTRALPLERYYRDVRGGLSHPMNDDQALTLLGRLAIETER